jgi:hypothetical protein
MTEKRTQLHVIEGGGEGGDRPQVVPRQEMASWWASVRVKERRIRQARCMARKLGLRLSNLRSVNNVHADLWVLAVPRSFDEVEAELLERMRQREHFQDQT